MGGEISSTENSGVEFVALHRRLVAIYGNRARSFDPESGWTLRLDGALAIKAVFEGEPLCPQQVAERFPDALAQALFASVAITKKPTE